MKVFLFLVILFNINCFHLIFGMDPKGKGKMVHEDPKPIQQYYSSSSPEDEEEPDENGIPIFKFSLIELSVLIRFLRSISLEPMPYNLREMQVIQSHTRDVLKNNFNEELYNAFINDFEKGKGTNFSFKIYQIIDYYTNMLTIYQEIEDYIIDEENKNFFYFWHLFGIARELIRQFVTFHKDDKYYNNVLINRNPSEEISIQSYAEAYDIFEIKANLLMKELKGNKNLAEDTNCFDYVYKDVDLKRDSILMSLSAAEATINNPNIPESNKYVFYPVKFAQNLSIEVFPNIYNFWPVIYRNDTVYDQSMTIKLCNYINKNIIDPETKKLNVPYYEFFYKMENKIQNMLQHTVTNNYFTNKLLKGPKEYLDDDIVELIDMGNNIFVPSQVYFDMAIKIYTENLKQIKQKLREEKSRRGGSGRHHHGSPSGRH